MSAAAHSLTAWACRRVGTVLLVFSLNPASGALGLGSITDVPVSGKRRPHDQAG
jgi:hypothetical protein